MQELHTAVGERRGEGDTPRSEAVRLTLERHARTIRAMRQGRDPDPLGLVTDAGNQWYVLGPSAVKQLQREGWVTQVLVCSPLLLLVARFVQAPHGHELGMWVPSVGTVGFDVGVATEVRDWDDLYALSDEDATLIEVTGEDGPWLSHLDERLPILEDIRARFAARDKKARADLNAERARERERIARATQQARHRALATAAERFGATEPTTPESTTPERTRSPESVLTAPRTEPGQH